MENGMVAIKIVLAGDQVSGKTCMFANYLQRKIPQQYSPTIFDSQIKNIMVDHQNIQLTVWDSGGKQIYHQFSSISYKDTDIFLIVFSVVDANSYHNAKQKWYKEISENYPGAIIIFVGNKIDLRASTSQVLNKEVIDKQKAAQQIRNQCGCSYTQCSALSKEGVNEVFTKAIQKRLGIRDSLRRTTDRKAQPPPQTQNSPSKNKIKRNHDECCVIM